jgi:hypothetical protein
MALSEPRTSLEKLLKVALYFLVLLIAVASARPLLQSSGIDALDGLGALATGAAVGLSFAIAVGLVLTGRASLRPFGHMWMAVYGLLITAALGVGLFLYKNDPSETARDFASFICFGSAVVIGSSRATWSVLRGPLLLTCLLSVLLGVVGVMQFRQFAGDVATGTRVAGGDTSLNDLLPVFGMLPLAIFTMPWWRRTGLLIIVLAWCSAITAAVLLQSRLESAYWICCGLITVILVISNYCTIGFRPATKRSFVLAVVVCVMGVAIAVLGGTIRAQASSLLERFDGKIQANRAYDGGVFAVLGSENERWGILSACWSDFGPAERIRGRGMGGSFEWLTSIVDAVNEQSRRERQDALWLDDAKVFGRRQIEVGWGNPFIKGGLLLTGWMILGAVIAIAAAIRSRSPFAMVCALAVFMNGAYAVFGGDFIIGALAKMLGAGLSIGFLLSRGWRTDPWVGALRARSPSRLVRTSSQSSFVRASVANETS